MKTGPSCSVLVNKSKYIIKILKLKTWNYLSLQIIFFTNFRAKTFPVFTMCKIVQKIIYVV